MRFQLNVYGSPWAANNAADVRCFIEAAWSAGHDIARVFFFFDGVYHGLISQSPASDEPNPLAYWQALAQANVDLLLCIAAATNRGVLDEAESRRYQQTVTTSAPFFELTGLGQWAVGFHDVDRIITFK
ncbi:sulfurtransferase complex subunit TusD [Reinekea sp.]|jgi:tRNA 2-thiouridine synthesizing protein D|uniref:sulfurtransferase complex subunit TusD n=1 Tax=Reinekea sp. TaxID=1970455 RepID=UPI002A80DAD8|nr:sulfurtransferase complex subunit TusD [Reinekea sp.]